MLSLFFTTREEGRKNDSSESLGNKKQIQTLLPPEIENIIIDYAGPAQKQEPSFGTIRAIPEAIKQEGEADCIRGLAIACCSPCVCLFAFFADLPEVYSRHKEEKEREKFFSEPYTSLELS